MAALEGPCVASPGYVATTTWDPGLLGTVMTIPAVESPTCIDERARAGSITAPSRAIDTLPVGAVPFSKG